MSVHRAANVSEMGARKAGTWVKGGWLGRLKRGGALISTVRRSAEEWVSEDWASVAKAINQRVDELGMSQRTLAQRAQVSTAIIREIQQNRIQRRRNAKTLEALSVALNWPPEYLSAVLDGHDPADASSRQSDDVPNRLTAMERQLRTISRQLATLNANLEAVLDDRRKR